MQALLVEGAVVEGGIEAAKFGLGLPIELQGDVGGLFLAAAGERQQQHGRESQALEHGLGFL